MLSHVQELPRAAEPTGLRTNLSLQRLVLMSASVCLVGSALIGILILVAQDLVYHPRGYPTNYRRMFSPGMAELRFKSSAGWQSAFYVPPHDGAAVPDQIWVAFCGNGSLALDWLPFTARANKLGTAFLLVDYPGYGNSAGRAGIINNRAAANEALNALAARLRVRVSVLEPGLNVIGHSLGAAVALDFAARHRVGIVILLAPFTSLREEAATFLGSWLAHLFRDNYDNRAALHELARRQPPLRVVIFHGLQDGLISPHMGRQLATEFPVFVTFRPVPDATHDNVVAAAESEILAIINRETSRGD